MRNRLSLIALTLASLGTLAACSSNSGTESAPSSSAAHTVVSSSSPTNSKASSSKALLSALDAAATTGFTCRLGNTVIAQHGSGDSWQSFYGSYIDGPNRGLEIFTINMVSYARWLGAPLDDAPPAQAKRIKSLAGAWATANQPDTILLEELPATPSRCLEWVTINADKITSVRNTATGEWSFQTTLLAPNDALITATGSTTAKGGRMTGFTVVSNGEPLIEISFELPKEFPATDSYELTPGTTVQAPGKAVVLTQDQYFELVGS